MLFSEIPTFGGTDADWQTWREEVESALQMLEIGGRSEAQCSAGRNITAILGAADSISAATVADLVSQIDRKGAEFKQANVLLCHMLFQRTTGRAREVVRLHAQTKCGASAWLKLRERFGPMQATGLIDVLEFRWSGHPEDNWRVFCTRVGRVREMLSDEVLELLVTKGMGMCGAKALQEAIKLKSPQTWSDLSDQVDRYVATMRMDGSGACEPVPMEVDVVHTAPGKGRWEAEQRQTKGGGKGSKTGFQGSCFRCGRQRHRASECPYARQGEAGGKGGKQSAASTMQCYECRGYGHRAAECANRRVVNAVQADGAMDVAAADKQSSVAEVFYIDTSLIMVDSGATAHVCPPTFCADHELKRRTNLPILVTASGGRG